MNIERLTQVRDWLAAGGDEETVSFDMEAYIIHKKEEDGWPSCATTCCIGGYIELKWGKVGEIRPEYLVGLTTKQWYSLCFPSSNLSDGSSPYDATAEQAAKVVDHLIKTGEVDWEKALD